MPVLALSLTHTKFHSSTHQHANMHTERVWSGGGSVRASGVVTCAYCRGRGYTILLLGLLWGDACLSLSHPPLHCQKHVLSRTPPSSPTHHLTRARALSLSLALSPPPPLSHTRIRSQSCFQLHWVLVLCVSVPLHLHKSLDISTRVRTWHQTRLYV